MCTSGHGAGGVPERLCFLFELEVALEHRRKVLSVYGAALTKYNNGMA